MKKICYIVTIPVTIRSFFINQLKYLCKKGYNVTVICSYDEKIKDDLGEKIQYIPINIPRGISIIKSILALIDLYKIIKKEKFDIIQYSTPNASLYASIISKYLGCKIRNYHLMGYRYLGATGINRFFLKNIERITCKLSTNIECVSKSNMELGIKEKLFPSEKVVVVWNGSSGGIDLKRFNFLKRNYWRKEIREKIGFKDNDFVYGFVGRITKDKGIVELLKSFSKLENDDKLLIVGTIENISSDIHNSIIENRNIIIHEAVNDIEKFYAAIDVLILPSYREGFGNVVIEAAAVGTPAIVSRIPGPIDAIEIGKTGLVVEPQNVKDLTEKMKQIKKLDYILMGKYAEQYCREKFDSDILCSKIFERKETLLNKK